MRITITSVFVNDQESALMFYTNVLGFQVKHNVPMGTCMDHGRFTDQP